MAPPLKSTANTDVLWGPWTFCAQPPGKITHPDDLDAANPDWLPAVVPGTVAAGLAAAGRSIFDRPLVADSSDWWFRSTFLVPEHLDAHPWHLHCNGLATLAEVWLNGERLLTTDNMFRTYRIDVRKHLRSENELVLGFRSIALALSQKRPRPRWKTNLVAQQQLRWLRTTLLGRIPGWTPAIPPVGPWRAIELSHHSIEDPRITSTLEDDCGVVTLQARVLGNARFERAVFTVGQRAVSAEIDRDVIKATLRIPTPPRWWPHTHGDQPLHDATLEVTTGSQEETYSCGTIGFRDISAIPGERFGLKVNGVPVYCRGACWTVSDIVTLDGTAESLGRDLRLARDAGANMVRVGGTMIYESDLFYQLCDELGILVWQDFQFANMDYPVDDPAFAANIEAEAAEQLARLSRHPCVAVYCGNSEVEQQAAMLGMPETLWRSKWFGERLPALCAELHPNALYVPSTPSGGVLPFHLSQGVAHYFGVGAYLRTPADVRKDDVAFTPECLAFANVPEQATLGLLANDIPPIHHPRWKERVPRDTGMGWDFDDVRDHYLRCLFDLDPVLLRSHDPGRYLQLSRIVPGAMMTSVFAEWRSGYSNNTGGLIWFFKDLWPGAGWGIVDSQSVPKAPYYALRRIWQPRQIVVTDEGLNGLHLHAINETATDFAGSIELVLLKDDHIIVARKQVPCAVAARSRQTFTSDAILEAFYDVAYAYRFGPPKHETVIATLLDAREHVVSEAFFFPLRREPRMLPAAVVHAQAEPAGDGCYQLTVRSDRFLQSVSCDVKGFLPDDNYFHLSPLRARAILLRPIGPPAGKLSGYVETINLGTPVKIAW